MIKVISGYTSWPRGDPHPSMTKNNRTPVLIAVLGIAIEVVAIVLLATKQIAASVATPVIITGMVMAFVPLFVVARRSKRR